jgi:hypothetical protein
MVDLVMEVVVCYKYVDVIRSCGSTKMCSGNKWSSIWPFFLLCKTYDDQWIIVEKESDKFCMLNLAISQCDGK